MDFSALLTKEINKKKNAVAGKGSSDGAPPKFVRRADLEKARQEKYLSEQQELERKRKEKEDKALKERLEQEEENHLAKRRKVEQEARKRRENSAQEGDEISRSQSPSLIPEQDLSEDEINTRLRKLGKPIRVFGESQKARIRRLLRCEKRVEIEQQKRLEAEEERALDFRISPQDIKDNPSKVYKQISKYLRYIISDWHIYLKERSDSNDRAYGVLEQTKSYLDPLFRLLSKEDLPESIYPTLSTLVLYLQQGKYDDANDTYIKLSIGNAAWPIGVTAVGIHERSAQNRITGHSNKGQSGTLGRGSVQIAHVMTDERTRKWLQAVKRLITFVQGRFPE